MYEKYMKASLPLSGVVEVPLTPVIYLFLRLFWSWENARWVSSVVFFKVQTCDAQSTRCYTTFITFRLSTLGARDTLCFSTVKWKMEGLGGDCVCVCVKEQFPCPSQCSWTTEGVILKVFLWKSSSVARTFSCEPWLCLRAICRR